MAQRHTPQRLCDDALNFLAQNRATDAINDHCVVTEGGKVTALRHCVGHELFQRIGLRDAGEVVLSLKVSNLEAGSAATTHAKHTSELDHTWRAR